MPSLPNGNSQSYILVGMEGVEERSRTKSVKPFKITLTETMLASTILYTLCTLKAYENTEKQRTFFVLCIKFYTVRSYK